MPLRAAHAHRPVRRVGWLVAALLALLLIAPAFAAAQSKPPPLPDCFSSGSGYGLCQGAVIPGGGSVTKLIAPEDSKGDFVLSGPAPLQSTQPVACGDAGCIYNHLDWSVGAGAVVVRGCQVNESLCEVRVPQRLAAWTPVYVRQNNDDKTLWAIWNSGHAAGKITGKVDGKECGETCRVVPLTGVTVSANGPRGGGSATTDSSGHYSMTVPRGRGYRVSAKLRGLVFKPEERTVNVTGTVSGVDFRAEPECGLTLGARAATATGCQLKITIATDPKKVVLKANDAGKLAAKYVKVRVKVANPSGSPIDGAQLLSLQPVPTDPTQQLDQLAFARGALPVSLGAIAGGADKVKTFDLKVTGDGDYQIKALALFDDPSRPGGNGRAIGTGGKFSVLAPLLYYTAETRNKFVSDGDSWFVTGHVRNLSTHQTLCLSPLHPHWQGNAGGLGPHQIGVVPVDDPAPPLAGPLAPGQTISFLMRAQTEYGGGTTSAVALEPRATKGDPGDACKVLSTDKRPAISKDEVKLAPDSTHFQVRVDKYRSSLGGAGALEFFGAYAKGSATALAHLYESGVSLVNEYGTREKLVAALGRGASAALSSLYHAAALDAWFYFAATPEERQQFIDQTVADFEAKTHQVWDGVQTSVQQSVGKWLEDVYSAYVSGDSQALFHTLGEGAGTTLTDTAIQMAEWELAIGIVKKTGAVGRTILRAGGESSVLESLKAVPAGRLLNFAEMQRLWGLAYEDYVNFSRIAEEEGVLIGVRGRSPISVKNLEEGAVWKHEELKPKNVNAIDIQYLGFNGADDGLVAFRTYTLREQDAILRQISRISNPAERAAAKSRALTRFGERTYVRTIEGFSKEGRIDVRFNYADNGATAESSSKIRAFNLESEQLADGQVYYRPYQENPALDGLANGSGKLPSAASKCVRKIIDAIAKMLCRVTGDMDGVYLTNLKGGAVEEALRVRVYEKLMAVGWQHPETLTWIKQGLFDFEAKTKILKGLELGGEAMMEFSPSGVRATYLNLAQSTLTSVGDYFVAVAGGYTSLGELGNL